VLFELRGRGSKYNADHPDDHWPNHFPFVLWDGSIPVGVIRVDLQNDVAVFRRVAVREDVQRRGYGRRMLELAAQFAEQHACSRIDSHVDAGAVGFYSRCGFDRVDDSAEQRDTVLMTRRLHR
jgi:GNAT superfamily N-acetyltransferase